MLLKSQPKARKAKSPKRELGRSSDSLERLVRHRERIVTDSLGFRLEVEMVVCDIQPRGRHRTYEDEQGRVGSGAPHRIEIDIALYGEELAEVIAHEVYHLFYSVRQLITTDEETEAEVFGHLVKRLHIAAQMPNNRSKPPL